MHRHRLLEYFEPCYTEYSALHSAAVVNVFGAKRMAVRVMINIESDLNAEKMEVKCTSTGHAAHVTVSLIYIRINRNATV